MAVEVATLLRRPRLHRLTAAWSGSAWVVAGGLARTARRGRAAVPRVARRSLPLAVVLAVLATTAGLGTLTVRTIQDGPPYRLGASRPVGLPQLQERSEVLASDGTLLARLHSGQDRMLLSLDQISPHLVAAVLAVEDSEFFRHEGVDVRGVARALSENLDAGTVVQGASTITQQVAKLHSGAPGRDLESKIEETGVALALERRYSKTEILEHYLNAVYLGHGAYGAGAAAHLYFGKDAADLDVAEAALLAGLVANPKRYDPLAAPEAARQRRAAVVERMVEEGTLTVDHARTAREAPLPTELHRPEAPPDHELFVAEVRGQLLRDERLGATYEERYRQVFGGGLVIHTTIDPELQAQAVRAITDGLPDSPFTASLAAVDPVSGEVRAAVGSLEPVESDFNLATQGARQPGSAFKMITLTAALEAGYSPDDLVDGSAPCEFPMPHGQEPWVVRNYEGMGGGVVPLREALSRSLNCAFARLVLGLGPDRVVDMAHRLGIDRDLDPYPSITLGAEEVSPLDMATAAATLAADGVRRGPVLVQRVERRDGTVVIDNQAGEERAVSPEVTRHVTDVLRGVVERGTGTAAAIGRPVAGKTGTAQQWRNAWFVGYTPQLAAAVWMGSRDAEVSMLDVGGVRVTGGSYPARMWAAFMAAAHEGLPVVDFPPADPGILPPAGYADETGRLDSPPPDPDPPPDRDGGSDDQGDEEDERDERDERDEDADGDEEDEKPSRGRGRGGPNR